MTIATTLNRVAYNGDGVSTIFAYPFEIFLASDLQVYDIVNATGVASLLAINVDYTVSGAGVPTGGNVTKTVALAAGHTLVIIRVEPMTQASALPSNDKFPTTVVETALDKLTMLVQQLNEVDQRSLKLALTSLYSNLTVPDPAATKYLRWKADLSGLENSDVVTSGTLGIPVPLASGGTGLNAASIPALLQGLNAGVWKQGADLVAAATIPLVNPLDGNLVKVTGNTGVTALATTGIAAGTRIVLWFTGTPTLTHGANFYLKNALNYTVAANDLIEFIYLGSSKWQEINRVNAATAMIAPTNHGRLFGVSGTQIKFGAFNGRYLPVKTSGVWQLRDISSSGIVSGNPTTASNFVNGVAAQALAANTTYLVTVFDNSGTLTFDFLTTLTHIPDANTGVEIKNGDDTRTVVGMVRTNGSTNFEADAAIIGIISWYNRRALGFSNTFTAARTTTSATFVEINSEIRIGFLVWADESIQISFNGMVSNLGANSCNTCISIDGNQLDARVDTIPTTGNLGCCSLSFTETGQTAGEGYHYATVLGATAASTATWPGTSGVGNERCSLHVITRG